MATVYVQYLHEDLINNETEELCFICATKLAMTVDPTEHKIEIVTADYDLNKCDSCGGYRQGVISI